MKFLYRGQNRLGRKNSGALSRKHPHSTRDLPQLPRTEIHPRPSSLARKPTLGPAPCTEIHSHPNSLARKPALGPAPLHGNILSAQPPCTENHSDPDPKLAFCQSRSIPTNEPSVEFQQNPSRKNRDTNEWVPRTSSKITNDSNQLKLSENPTGDEILKINGRRKRRFLGGLSSVGLGSPVCYVRSQLNKSFKSLRTKLYNLLKTLCTSSDMDNHTTL